MTCIFFPRSLERPDFAGTTLTRSPETEDAYRTRYRGMAKTLSRLREEPVSVLDVIDDLRRRAARLKKNSFYLFRAAIIQELRDWFALGTLSAEEAQRLVDRLKPDLHERRSRRSHIVQATSSCPARQTIRPWRQWHEAAAIQPLTISLICWNAGSLLAGSKVGIVYSEHVELDGPTVSWPPARWRGDHLQPPRQAISAGTCKHWIKVKIPAASAMTRLSSDDLSKWASMREPRKRLRSPR